MAAAIVGAVLQQVASALSAVDQIEGMVVSNSVTLVSLLAKISQMLKLGQCKPQLLLSVAVAAS